MEIEAPRVGGRVDVLATKEDERIGIEIETGKSNVVENVRHCLLSGYTRVYVVATSLSTSAAVTDAILNSDLSHSQRVVVCVAKHEPP